MLKKPMEHRLATRFTVDTWVRIHSRGHAPIWGKVTNINDEGMCVQCVGEGLRKGTGLEIEIADGRGERLPGVVIHHRKRNIGVLLVPVPGGLMERMEKLRQLEKRQA